MIKTQIVEGELPYRITIDSLSGAGDSPARAAMAALSVGKRIPIGIRDAKAAAMHIFWHYLTNPDWAKLIHILESNSFVETIQD